MLDISVLKPIFSDKLATTGSLDEAFLKCVWIAYKAGLNDAITPCAHSPQILTPFIESTHYE